MQCTSWFSLSATLVAHQSKQRGVLVRHGGALEKLAQASVLFFDKTGTLTGGQARLVAIAAEPSTNSERVLRLAASLDQMSNHAIAQAIVKAAIDRGIALSMPSSVREQPGAGIAGVVEGRDVRVGSYDYVAGTSMQPQWIARFLQRVGHEGASSIYVSIDGKLCGALQMADEIRLDTPRALRLLRAAGIRKVVMLTGDRRDVAQTIAATLGADEVLAEQAPAEKLAAIGASRKDGVTVMVGDGVNDAPALAAADVGVAMGARGAAAAAEAAQVVLLVDRLDRLAFALRIAKKARAIAVQSAAAGMGLSVAAMVVAAFGYLPPVAGAAARRRLAVVETGQARHSGTETHLVLARCDPALALRSRRGDLSQSRVAPFSA